MSNEIQIPKPVWVCGLTKDPPYEGDRPKGSYVFFELDKPNDEYKNEVLEVYSEMKIPVVYHRIRRGFHFFGDLRPDEVKNSLQKRLQNLNFDGSFNTTLRVKRKTPDEVFEMPLYQGPEPRPNWAKALMYFLSLEYRKEISNYDIAAEKCGLHKYFKPQKGHFIIFYPLCHICLTALPTEPENKLKHYQEAHGMFSENKI